MGLAGILDNKFIKPRLIDAQQYKGYRMSSAKPSKHKISALLKLFIKSNKNIKQFASENGMPENTARRWLIDYAKFYGLTPAATASRTPGDKAEKQPSETFLRQLPNVEVYVFTSAQSCTMANVNFLASLKVYCRRHAGHLAIATIRYKNPTSLSESSGADEWWDEPIKPYLTDLRANIGGSLMFLADIKTQPTAEDPLSGFEGISGDRSCIIGHPKVAFKTIAAPSRSRPKILVTTGSITLPNYSDTKAGKKGEFHHCHSAIVVEVKGKTFHLRHLHAVKDGSFIDLDTEYTPTGYRKAPPAEALVMGDTHAMFVDKKVLAAATAGKNSMVHRLKPKVIVWHDLLDFYSANHHHRNKPFLAVAKYRSGANLVGEEIKQSFGLVKDVALRFPKVIHVFPESNHNEALSRWLSEADWREDPANAQTYLELALLMVKSAKIGPNGSEYANPFVHCGLDILGNSPRFKFLSSRTPCIIKGIDVGQHGHLGANGAKGSIKGFAKLGIKTITGHGHTPGIEGGAYRVGTNSKDQMEYTYGPSSWLHTNAVIYGNGKRVLTTIIHGECTFRWRQ